MKRSISQTEKEKIVFQFCKISFTLLYDICYLIEYKTGGNDSTAKTLKGAINKAYRNLIADGVIY